jgi:chemotaxis-related protein WspB
MLILTFTAAANRYAIDVTRVVEVVPKVELRSIPHAPAYLSGLLGYRGKVVPVLDLGSLLGIAPCRDWLSTRIILVNDAPGGHQNRSEDRDSSHDDPAGTWGSQGPDPALLGLIAEHVSDLTYARPEQIIPAPVSLPQTPYLGALIQTDHGIVQLIVIEHVRAASLPASCLDRDATWNLNSQPTPLIG